MRFGLPGSFQFAAHLFGLLVAGGAAIALMVERDRSRGARLFGALGFASLAVAEGLHGAGILVELDPTRAWIRSGGYLLLLIGALLPRVRATEAVMVPAVLPVPGGTVTPLVVAALAAVVGLIRRRGEPGAVWLAAGVLLLGVSDAVLGVDRWWAPNVSHGLRIAGWIAVARIVLALARHSIRFRFIVGFSALLVAVVLFVSAAIGTVIDRNLREGAIDRVQGQARQAVENLNNKATSRVNALAALATGLADNIERGEGVSEESLEEFRDRFLPDVNFIVVFDDGLGVRGTLDVEPGDDVQIAGTYVVKRSLRQGRAGAALDAIGEGLSLLGVAPIRGTEGGRRPDGMVVAGFTLTEDLLDGEAIASAESRVIALVGRRGSDPVLVAAAGFGSDVPQIPAGARDTLAEAFTDFLTGAQPLGTTLRLDNEEHFAALTPLRTELYEGEPVGMLVVAEPATVLAATQRQVNQVLFLITVAVIGLAFGLALIAARRITKPLVTLTGAARRVSAGDLDTKAEVGGEDEVADLAAAFNRMTDSVTGMTEELRLAATEQSQLRARLETVVNSMGDGLIAVDDDGRVVTYNPAASTIVGTPRSRVVGKPLREVLSGRDSRGRRLGGRSAPNGLAFLARPDGTEVPVAITSSPLRDGHGARLGRVYVMRDMSREYEVDRMKREFLSNVSHELRTPLTPIIGYSEIMTRRTLPVEKAKEFAGSILDSARRLERIVAMLVDFSAIEAGRMAVDVEPTPIGPLVKEAVASVEARKNRHQFVTRVARGLPPALVSPRLFQRTLGELLDNAVKYSPKGGRVTVSVDRAPKGGRRMLEITVTDQGIGIEEKNLAGIFQDFSQVDASDTRPFGGLGLGLTFVKRIAEAQGGAVSAESKPGKGSSFRFSIPAADTQSGKSKR